MSKTKRKRPIDRIIENQNKRWDYLTKSVEQKQVKQERRIQQLDTKVQQSKQQSRKDLATLALLTKNIDIQTHPEQSECDICHRHPLDWAPGSVRSIIALTILYVFCFISICDLVPTLLWGYPLYIKAEWYCGIFITVLGSYFIMRIKTR